MTKLKLDLYQVKSNLYTKVQYLKSLQKKGKERKTEYYQ